MSDKAGLELGLGSSALISSFDPGLDSSFSFGCVGSFGSGVFSSGLGDSRISSCAVTRISAGSVAGFRENILAHIVRRWTDWGGTC